MQGNFGRVALLLAAGLSISDGFAVPSTLPGVSSIFRQGGALAAKGPGRCLLRGGAGVMNRRPRSTMQVHHIPCGLAWSHSASMHSLHPWAILGTFLRL